MKFAKKVLVVVVAVVLAGALAGILAPKVGHALPITLVKVVNTAASPAVTEDVSKAASQIREVSCPIPSPGTLSGPCLVELPNAANGGTFTVPPGMSFVISSITFEPISPGPGVNLLGLVQSGASRQGFTVTNATVTVLQFPTSGIVLSPGSTLAIRSEKSNAGPVEVFILGYLTTN